MDSEKGIMTPTAGATTYGVSSMMAMNTPTIEAVISCWMRYFLAIMKSDTTMAFIGSLLSA